MLLFYDLIDTNCFIFQTETEECNLYIALKYKYCQHFAFAQNKNSALSEQF
jgi:hypothetical protein